MTGRCRACGGSGTLDVHGRCRLCREAKAASDAGSSYGRYKSMIYMRYGDLPEIPDDWYLQCPVCKKVFLPRRKNQIYDCAACAQRAASKKYYTKRKRAGHGAPAGNSEANYGADAADQDGGRADQDQPGPENQKI